MALVAGLILFIGGSRVNGRTRLGSPRSRAEVVGSPSSTRNRRQSTPQSDKTEPGSKSPYVDPVNGYFKVSLPPKCRVLAPNGTKAKPGVSRLSFCIGSMATIAVGVEKTLSTTVDPKELDPFFRAWYVKPLHRWIKVDGVKAAQATALSHGKFFRMVKYKKHGLEHTILLVCSIAQRNTYRRTLASFLATYRSMPPSVWRRQSGTGTRRSPVGVQTPLGIVEEAGVASGIDMRLGNHKVKPGHVFVTLKMVAKRRYGLVSIGDWRLIDLQGKAYPVLGVMTDFGTLFGVGSLAAYGSMSSPKINTFVYEVPTTSKYVDFRIGNRTIGRVPFGR